MLSLCALDGIAVHDLARRGSVACPPNVLVMPPDRTHSHSCTVPQAVTAHLLLASTAEPQRLTTGRLHTDSVPLFCTNATTICDAPRFRHRGLLIDTGRHFLPLRIIKARSQPFLAGSFLLAQPLDVWECRAQDSHPPEHPHLTLCLTETAGYSDTLQLAIVTCLRGVTVILTRV